MSAELHSGFVRFSLTFLVTTLFARADPKCVELTPSSIPLVNVTCMFGQRFQAFHKFLLWLNLHQNRDEISVCLWNKAPTCIAAVAPLIFTAELTQTRKYLSTIVLETIFTLWRISRVFWWARPACLPQIIILAPGNTSHTALAEEESASCQWTATCIPSSLALRNGQACSILFSRFLHALVQFFLYNFVPAFLAEMMRAPRLFMQFLMVNVAFCYANHVFAMYHQQRLQHVSTTRTHPHFNFHVVLGSLTHFVKHWFSNGIHAISNCVHKNIFASMPWACFWVPCESTNQETWVPDTSVIRTPESRTTH